MSKSSKRTAGLSAGLIGLALSLSAHASALSVSPGSIDYDVTILCAVGRGCPTPAPIFSATGSVSVELTRGLPEGGVVQGGTVDPSNWTVVLQVSSDLTSDDPSTFGDVFVYAVNFNAFGAMTITGAGTVPGPESDVSGFDFFFGPAVSPGSQSDRFFQSYSSLAEGDTIEVRLFLGLSSSDEMVVFTVVPEPSTSLLLLAGLAAFTLPQGKRFS